MGGGPDRACSAASARKAMASAFRVTASGKRLAHEAKLDVREAFSQRSKLYQWRDDEWQVIGLGNAVLLEHGSPPRVRFVMGQEITMKTACNFIGTRTPLYCELQPHLDSYRLLRWKVLVCADGEPKTVHYASWNLVRAFRI